MVYVDVKVKQIQKNKQGKIILCFTKVLMNEYNMCIIVLINVCNLLAVEAPE